MSEFERTSRELLEQTAAHLGEAVAELAGKLRPFPAFMGMTSLQAIELEPPPESENEWGCVVVLPDGEICELDLRVMPSFEEIDEVEQVEEFRELELSATEYIQYAANAIRALHQELRRRGQ
jgi:uncharacterized protein YoaH (UPF0181 family)